MPPPSAFGRAAASPQTRQMRCWPSPAVAVARRRPSGRRIPRPAASGRTRSLSLVLFPPKPLRWVSAGFRDFTPQRDDCSFALRGLNIPAAGTHATRPPNRAHSGSHAETRRVLRVDGDDVSGNGIIDTIDPFQADQTVAVALAEGHRNAVSP